MSHADDGTLHAYLDGELNAVERAQLEAHLAECAPCRARVEEERALIERAQGLLAHAAPGERELPPFRQVRRRAVRPLPRWVPLAWAASVLLALGGGWLVGERGSSAMAPEQSLTRSEPTTVSLDEADRLERATPQAGNGPARTPEQAAPATNREPNVVLDGGLAQGGRVSDVAEQKVGAERLQFQQRDAERRLAAAPAEGPAHREAAGDTVGHPRPAGVSPGAAAAPQAAAAAPSARPSPALETVVVTGFASDTAAAWSPVSLDSARAILQTEPVAISELPVRTVLASNGGVVLVEQPISSNSTIRLYQRRAESAEHRFRARVDAPQRAAEHQLQATELLARYVGPLRVEIAGPLSADSLSRLLEKVRPIR